MNRLLTKEVQNMIKQNITVQGYILEEDDLNSNNEIVKNILNKQRNINVDYDRWYEPRIYDQKDILNKLGFADPEIYFTGFYSQGDGASFTGEYTGYNKKEILELKNEYPQDKELHEIIDRFLDFNVCIEENYDIYVKIDKNHMYCHEETMYINQAYIDLPLPDDDEEDIEYTFIELCKDIARYFYEWLKKDYEYLESDESVLETILLNDYIFDEDGNIL